MLNFASDYVALCHPAILARMQQLLESRFPGYGTDAVCAAAREKIRAACRCPAAEVEFLVGGTQTNATVIDALLRPWQGVVAVESGHVNVHEAGAIEAGGHKVLALPEKNGKLAASALQAYLEAFWADENCAHMVQPGMVYISHPTEYGTLYTAEELHALHKVCRDWEIPLYLDGARLGYGLAAEPTVDLPTIAVCCDAFYIGGTKVGALLGEAVVLPKPIPHFFTLVKQHGALLAKGALLGLQFDTLFTDDLYLKISAHAIALARTLRAVLLEKGYPLLIDSPTNQLFPILENTQLAALEEKVCCSVWEKVDANHTAIRLATSWSTTQEELDALCALL